MDKIDLIYDLMKSQSVKIDKMDDTLGSIAHETKRNADDLQEHMRRTRILEKRDEEKESRISTLEEPSKVFSVIKKWVVNISIVVTAIAGIYKYLG